MSDEEHILWESCLTKTKKKKEYHKLDYDNIISYTV